MAATRAVVVGQLAATIIKGEDMYKLQLHSSKQIFNQALLAIFKKVYVEMH